MKKQITFYMTILCFLGAMSVAFGQKAVKDKKKKIPVRGNCGMCETTIEEAALSIEGVSSAEWNQEQELLVVRYSPSRVEVLEIEKAIAKKGYDTKNVEGDSIAYSQLPDCCVYSDKKKE